MNKLFLENMWPETGQPKADLDHFVKSVIEEVDSGVVNALPVYVKAKMVAKAMANIIEAIERQSQDECFSYENGGKNVEMYGCKVSYREAYETPDTSTDSRLAELKSAAKAREDLLKQAFKNDGKAFIVDPDTGEVVPVCPPKKTKSTIAITL